jgi:hypothetical protein
MINELERTLKKVVSAQFKVLSWPGGTEENHEKPQSGNQSLSQDLKLGPPKYEVGFCAENWI